MAYPIYEYAIFNYAQRMQNFYKNQKSCIKILMLLNSRHCDTF